MTIPYACWIRRQLRIVVTLAVFMAPSGATVAATDAAVYTDALAAGWDNWSWNTTLNFTTTAPVHAGSKSLSVTYNAGWAGLYLHASGYDTSCLPSRNKPAPQALIVNRAMA